MQNLLFRVGPVVKTTCAEIVVIGSKSAHCVLAYFVGLYSMFCLFARVCAKQGVFKCVAVKDHFGRWRLLSHVTVVCVASSAVTLLCVHEGPCL